MSVALALACTEEPGSTEEPVCDPGPLEGALECVAPGTTRASWTFSELEGTSIVAFSSQCTVAAIGDDGEAQSITLSCFNASSPTLTLSTTAPHTPLALAKDDMVRIVYDTVLNGEKPGEHFALFDGADALLAAGVNLPDLPVTLGPVTFDLRGTDCEHTELRDCTVVQRAAVEARLGDASAVVFDGNAGALAGDVSYQLLVEGSTRQLCFEGSDPWCGYSDAPYQTEALLLRSPG